MLARGEFSVQKGSSVSYPGGNIVSEGESANLTITAGNITVPAGIGVASAGSSLSSPELKEFTINGTGQVGLNTPQVLTSGDFYAEPQIRIYQDTTLLSGAGEINLSSGVNNGSKALTLGDAAIRQAISLLVVCRCDTLRWVRVILTLSSMAACTSPRR